MIIGTVHYREAIIPVALIDQNNQEFQIEAVIDTGFGNYLTLSLSIVLQLNLTFRESAEFGLADGAVATLDLYRATVNWHGQQRGILVAATEDEPLAGMALLEDNRMMIEVIEGGTVTIEPI